MGTQHHNVIIFGAGASADAGIPMLNSFVDKMWEYAVRGKVGNKPISEPDRNILQGAEQIRIELEKYNSRAFFDNRNLEDILSLLSFEALAGGHHSIKYETLVKAVARTIELSCTLSHVEGTPKIPFQHSLYQRFWHSLLNSQIKDANPALITFNYDLVLERALWQYFHFVHNAAHKPEVASCALQYSFKEHEFKIKRAPHQYEIPRFGGDSMRFNQVEGEKAELSLQQDTEIKIPYLKLHGSLNWDRNASPEKVSTNAVETPLILPPVFNKMNSPDIYEVWKKALDLLRSAKNIIIVGYSLPKTDIYMQYFLKAAVGPNSDLQKIIVFDPVLFQQSDKAEDMMNRYRECFSPQFSGRIDFQPPHSGFSSKSRDLGTFQHFLHVLSGNFRQLFFFP